MVGRRHLREAGLIFTAVFCGLVLAAAVIIVTEGHVSASGTAGLSFKGTQLITKALTASAKTTIDLSVLGTIGRVNDTCSAQWVITGSGTVNLDIYPEISLDDPSELASTKLGWARAYDTPVVPWTVLTTPGAVALYVPLLQQVRLAVVEKAANAGLTIKIKVLCQ